LAEGRNCRPVYEDLISWKESDDGEYDVRDLIGILEALNVFDFPNDEDRHPIAAYEKWSIPLEKFGADFNSHRDNLRASKYYRLRELLRDGLALYDNIRHDFRAMHNATGGSAGLLKIVEEASARKGEFRFPFASLANDKYPPDKRRYVSDPWCVSELCRDRSEY